MSSAASTGKNASNNNTHHQTHSQPQKSPQGNAAANPLLAAAANTNANVHINSETGKVISHFKIGMQIGQGSFANVYKGVDLNNNNKTVAIKSVFRNRLKNQKLITNLEIEIKILRNLKNPHIVSLLDCVKTDHYFHLIMDYCSLGDLSYFIRKKSQLANHHPVVKSVLEKFPSPQNSNGLNETIVINFIKQLASALKFLRSQNLIHRDIKPQNLLLCSPAHSRDEFIENNYAGYWELPILKVADFGFARYLPATSLAETLCGSPLYMAPEILRYEKYNAKADLWSVGTVIYEMVIGRPPFRASNHIELLKKIEKSNDQINFPSDFEISADLIRLICNLLKANPIDRMGFNEFFNDPIITTYNEDLDSIHDDLLSNYSLENEEMYVSEYLTGKDLNNKNARRTEIDLSKPLNRLTIQEEQEQEDDDVDVDNNGNNMPHLKSNVSNGIITKETVQNNVKPTSMERSVEELLQQQQQQNQLQNQQRIVHDSPKKYIPAKVVVQSNSPLREHLKRKTGKMGNDLIVEKDYVVVEKRNVEVNTFADEIRRASNTSITSKPLKNQLPERTSFSKQRRYSMSVSPSGALKEVLDYTTEKLFGATNNINGIKTGTSRDDNNNDNNNNNVIKQQQSKIKSDDGADLEYNVDINKIVEQKPIISPNTISDKTDKGLINKIERLAMMAHAISLYADIKFDQVIPLPPSSNNNESNTATKRNSYYSEYDTLDAKGENNSDNDIHYIAIYKKLCQEGLTLYLKTLSLLSEAIKVSSEWWNANKFKSDITPKMGQLIQWIRNRFNESLERAEYLKLRMYRFDEENVVNVSNGNNDEGFICEKIIFDRAIEISKDTAVKELNFSNDIEELKKCEISYSISVWMLESLLYKFDSDKYHNNDEILDKGDQKIVENFINSIGTRLLILRSKIDNQELKNNN